MLGPSRALNGDFLAKVATDYQKKAVAKKKREEMSVNFHGLFPKELALFDFENIGKHKIIVDVPERKRKIKFDGSLEKYNGEYYFPHLVLCMVNGKLSIFIKKHDEFYAPFFPNMAGGDEIGVCMGTVTPEFRERMSFTELVEMVVNMYFGTLFTHIPTERFLMMKNKGSFPWKETKPKSLQISTPLIKDYLERRNA